MRDEALTASEAPAPLPEDRPPKPSPRPFLRRGGSYRLRSPRFVHRLQAREQDYGLRPPIIVNSFPHCSHPLLMHAVSHFPGVHHYGHSIISMPTIPFRERSAAAHGRLIRRIVPGEALGARMFFNRTYASDIATRNGVHFFMYRDLRDAAVCEADYLTWGNVWHRLHPFFARLRDNAERISAAIQGLAHDRFPYDYPDIARRFARYEGWLKRPDVMAIAYEDLCPERIEETIRRAARFYALKSRAAIDEDRAVKSACSAIAAVECHSSRQDGMGVWKDAFTPAHRRQFEDAAGTLNRRLGYG